MSAPASANQRVQTRWRRDTGESVHLGGATLLVLCTPRGLTSTPQSGVLSTGAPANVEFGAGPTLRGTCMRRNFLLLGLVLASQPAAQSPSADAFGLFADEVAALRHLRTWLAGPPNLDVPVLSREFGYDTVVFGRDRNGKEQRGPARNIDPEETCVMMLVPRGDALWQARLLFANRAGRIFVGVRPADAGADWRPTVATLSGPGVDVHINNMLLQSGTAVDGTSWLRIDDLPELVERPFRVRVHSTDGARLAASRVEIGASPFAWHPSWVPVDDARVASFRALLPQQAGEAVLEGSGVSAKGMRLLVRGLRLSPANVSYADGELLVSYGREELADVDWLEDQAWAVHALRLFAAAQHKAQQDCRIDRDRDGVGEFGMPGEVLPANQRTYQQLQNGRYLVFDHLFEVHVPADADGAEQRFVAYAWPAQAHDQHDRAFCIDASGIVRWCAAAGRFAGHDLAPAAGAGSDGEVWRPLQP